MTNRSPKLRELIEQIIGMAAAPVEFRVEDVPNGVGVTIARDRLDMVEGRPATELALEELAVTIETNIAAARARAMIEAAGEQPDLPPLWLVAGSQALAKWITWSRTETALRKVLTLADQPGLAPVAGYLDRRARHELGQGGAKIRVNGGQAVAERIELFGKLRCFVQFSRNVARIRVDGVRLPETLVGAAKRDDHANHARRVAEIVGHPFFDHVDVILEGVRNDGDAVEIDIEDGWAPLAPVPAVALRVVPHDADLASPWRITARERAALYTLVDEGRRHCGTA